MGCTQSMKLTLPNIVKNRKIIHCNLTDLTLDLYITIGNQTPKKIATLNPNNGIYVYQILDYSADNDPFGYDYNFSFNVLLKDEDIPKHNAGPTLVEFTTNQIINNELRDTFAISCVPAGIGTFLENDGQSSRDKACMLSRLAGYNIQQCYGYNFGCKVIPPFNTAIPSGNLKTVYINDPQAPHDTDAIGYPMDTKNKQQTGKSMGNYIIFWIYPYASIK